jgi:RNA polymerase sigma factor (sigma-70 family)
VDQEADDAELPRGSAALDVPLSDRRQRSERRVPLAPAGSAQLIEQAQMREGVEAALQELSPRDRAILTLHYQEERRHEEIAAILGQPMGTVKTNLYRARERLKVIMKERAWTIGYQKT